MDTRDSLNLLSSLNDPFNRSNEQSDDYRSASAAAGMVGGNAIFSSLPVGAKFKFPKSEDVMVKTSKAGGYKDPKGRKFKTGKNVAVVTVSDGTDLSEADLTDAADTTTETLAGIVKANKFLELRDALKKAGFKKVDFSTSPFPMYIIKQGGKTYAILNKRYVEKPDVVVGQIAVGVMDGDGSIKGQTLTDAVLKSEEIVGPLIKAIDDMDQKIGKLPKSVQKKADKIIQGIMDGANDLDNLLRRMINDSAGVSDGESNYDSGHSDQYEGPHQGASDQDPAEGRDPGEEVSDATGGSWKVGDKVVSINDKKWYHVYTVTRKADKFGLIVVADEQGIEASGTHESKWRAATSSEIKKAEKRSAKNDGVKFQCPKCNHISDSADHRFCEGCGVQFVRLNDGKKIKNKRRKLAKAALEQFSKKYKPKKMTADDADLTDAEKADSVMLRAYLDAILFTDMDDNDEPLDANFDHRSFAKEALNKAKKDINEFLAKVEGKHDDVEDDSLMHQFWYTRNGHGTGFWDHDEYEHYEDLDEAAQSMGEVWSYVGDDGKIYVQ